MIRIDERQGTHERKGARDPRQPTQITHGSQTAKLDRAFSPYINTGIKTIIAFWVAVIFYSVIFISAFVSTICIQFLVHNPQALVLSIWVGEKLEKFEVLVPVTIAKIRGE